MSCGVDCRRVSDPVLLWLWRRPAATAPTGPLAWEPPCAVGVALKQHKTKKKKKKIRNGNLRRFLGVFKFQQSGGLGKQGGVSTLIHGRKNSPSIRPRDFLDSGCVPSKLNTGLYNPSEITIPSCVCQ